LAAAKGTAAALVGGDHLLTAAYRVAARVESPAFLDAFIHAVERTVAGEIRQQRGIGRPLTAKEYRAAIEGKSGELFGACVVLATEWSGRGDGPGVAEGRRVGALYQMVDDAVDYCPSASVGKPALQDYEHRKYTFVLEAAGLTGFVLEADEVVARLFDPARGDGAARVLAALESEERAARSGFPDDDGLLGALLSGWVSMARGAIERQREAEVARRSEHRPSSASVEAEVVEQALAVGGPEAWGAYFGKHSKSFRFASRLFPAESRRQIEGVYAFCRFTDDLVDEADVAPPHARARLDVWRQIVESAYRGESTGVPLADQVMGEARSREVPFHYPEELLAGVAMDLEPICFQRLSDLEVYTYRVASVVGGWITELFGVRDPEVLSRAYAMGHAMQITNILRDVGEDWRNDRLYLPRDLMESYGVELGMVDRVAAGQGPVPAAYADLMEVLMEVAETHYRNAFAALPSLPRFYARPVAVAARVYEGIHDEIRRNRYDNGTRRAYTRVRTKLRLGWRGLRDLRRATLSRSHPAGLSLLAKGS
jgi:phytoene synthase